MSWKLVVDNFAGGGGASLGIQWGLGRPVDIAINHDPEAVAMHRLNHPETRHYCEDIWEVDPRRATNGLPVELCWLSPDCKHFSRAKGGKPVSKNIRGLAWIALKWAGTVRPEVIVLENVGEFVTWGPLRAKRDKYTGQVLKLDGATATPGERVPVGEQHLVADPRRRGRTFRHFVAALRRMGYEVEWRELTACDYGAPTIRKRFFMIARCDEYPIAWPEPTHGPGRENPYRTAAECIDWTQVCPSIFERKRPLAEATLRRIARGVMRYVVKNPTPFIVDVNHTASYYTPFRGQPLDDPLNTITQQNGRALIAPHITKFRTGSPGQSAQEPLHTVTACSVGEANHPGGAAPFGVVSANLVSYYGEKREADFRGSGLGEPVATQTTENRHALVATTLVQTGYGERPNQTPRALNIKKPLGTVVAEGTKHALIGACLVKQNFGEKPCSGADEPLHTVTTQGNRFQLVGAFLAKHYGGVIGSEIADPMGTVTSVDHHGLVAAHMVRQFGRSTGAACEEPVGTITAGGDGKTLIAASALARLKGTCRDGQPVTEPLRTINAGGMHFAEVRAFLRKYAGPTDTAEQPGLVRVQGMDCVIADIGMRMLQPRELYRAQGFPDDYRIDVMLDGKRLSKAAQVRMVGNSVCPQMAAAIVRANVVAVKEAIAV